jgi:type I restriction enzyme S subunit
VSGLPPTWTKAKLGEVAETRLGKMLSAKARTGVNSRPYLRNKNVQWGRFDLEDVWEMDFSAEEFQRFEVVPGDLLVCEGGEVGRAAIWRGEIAGMGYQKALHRVRPRAGVAPEFLLYLLMRLAQTNAFAPFVTGSTIKHLPQENLRDLPVPLPPLNEQRRIVTAIDEQFSRLDVARGLLVDARRKLAALRHGALASGFAGDWPWTTLGEIADIVGGVTKDAKRQNDPSFAEVPYLRVANVQRGYLDLSDIARIRVPRGKAEQLALKPGDVLFNEGGDRDKLGRGWVWSGEIADCIHQNHVFRARLRADFEPKFISWHGNTFGQSWFEANGRQTTNLASLNLTTLKSFPVPAPARDVQRRLVADVEARLTELQAVGDAIDTAERRSAALRRSILERAFRGAMVPQDPADDSAEVLLEHILAQSREAGPGRQGQVVA